MGTLNEGGLRVADELRRRAGELRVGVSSELGATLLDCGVESRGALQAGLLLARLCLADLADVTLAPAREVEPTCPTVQVVTDSPVAACLASQYAGWQVSAGKYFAMGSGPMRAAYGKEALFDKLPGREPAAAAVGALETKKRPPGEAIEVLASKLGISPAQLTLAFAPAASLAGGVQVVARSVETALHKLHELGFDVTKVVSGHGVAPLPPVAKDELQAIGRTNDAILYGAHVTLWVDCDDAELDAVGPRVPSSASPDHGALFAELFARYGDFYKIDPLLFSPAVVTFNNLSSGVSRTFGGLESALVRRSFAGG